MQADKFIRGFVYVATGAKYHKEAVKSARSLKAFNPDVPVCLICDATPNSDVFDDVILIENPVYGFADKFQMVRAPYQRSIFLDTDILIVDDMRDLFDCLDTYDIAAKPEVSPGLDYKLPGLPSSFPEFTTGVIAFKMGEKVRDFFSSWAEIYWELREKSPRFYPDQPSFRAALFRSDLRHCAIPTEYHLQGDFGACVYWKVKAIHCRHEQELRAKQVNAFLGLRFYDPNLGILPSGYRGLRNHLRLWLKINASFLAVTFRILIKKIRLPAQTTAFKSHPADRDPR